ncbi:MAG TPA: histone deacetylase [Gemmatimonadales bacterium]
MHQDIPRPAATTPDRPRPVVWHPAYEVDIGPHVFPTRKYRLIRERLRDEGTVTEGDLVTAMPVSDDDVALVHDREYVRKIADDALSTDERILLEVPFSPALREAMWLCAGGTALTGRLARDHGVAVHLGGGFHHAFPDHGEGFCLINDVAIAIRLLQREGVCARPVVVDLDVHQGNGTAAIFARDPAVFTCSFHQQHNYPAWKPPSDLDVGLDDGTGDAEYLALLDRHLPVILEQHRPDMAFYLAGADPYRLDQLGGLALTIEGLRRRDELVLRHLREADVAVAVTLAGGYARNPDDTVAIHCGTVHAARGAG